MPAPELLTPRLRLRPWRDDDAPSFAALNADPAVMRHFPACLDRTESDALAARLGEHVEAHGFGHWVVEQRSDGAFVGMLALLHVGFEAPFTPAVEIGWRLLPRFWGRGLAGEAAGAVLDFAFATLGLEEVVAFTVPANQPSWTLMQRLGMRRDEAGDFEHPRLPEGHPLRRHVLYRIVQADWAARR